MACIQAIIIIAICATLVISKDIAWQKPGCHKVGMYQTRKCCGIFCVSKYSSLNNNRILPNYKINKYEKHLQVIAEQSKFQIVYNFQ